MRTRAVPNQSICVVRRTGPLYSAPETVFNKDREILAQIIGVFFESALKVGLKPHDPDRGELPIVADLATTDETVGVLSVGEAKAGTDWNTCSEKRRVVKVGFNIAKAGTGIHANVPPGPARHGRRWRCVDWLIHI